MSSSSNALNASIKRGESTFGLTRAASSRKLSWKFQSRSSSRRFKEAGKRMSSMAKLPAQSCKFFGLNFPIGMEKWKREKESYDSKRPKHTFEHIEIIIERKNPN